MHTIDSLNQQFYTDPYQRQLYLQKAAELYRAATATIGAPDRILAVGRSWLSEYLTEDGKEVIYPAQIEAGDKFELIIALDEVLTRDSDEALQKKHITQIVGLLESGGTLLASLRDYRNTNCHRRPLGDACYSTLDDDNLITVEVNELNPKDKQSWNQRINVIVNNTEFVSLDTGPRRTLYFKQLAKYCADAGATNFGILKDTYWKGHLRRTPEHVAYARMK